MLKHSKAMLVLKAQAQDVLNFTVLVCHAVPSLNAYMKAVEKSNPDAPKLPDLDHFAVDTHVNLRKYREAYKKTIGRFILISSFSYFEAYVKNLVDELVAFHGGTTSLVETVKKRLRVPNKTDEADWADKVDSREKVRYGKPWPRLFCPMLCGTGLNHCYRPRPITARADGPASRIAQR